LCYNIYLKDLKDFMDIKRITKVFQKDKSSVVTRFAPSPTGFLHVGSARTALFSFLYAKQNKGKFILRIEDTDKERSKKEYEQDIRSGLDWLGLKCDKVYHQSERTNIYKKYLVKMIANGTAYEAEPARMTVQSGGENKDGTGKIIRFKNPNTSITFTDLIRGDITFDTTELKDFVIAKDINTPLYHLAVVVDDFEMGITHVIRGEDHISNTPRQILIQRAIDAPEPIYAHIPLILASDKSKLSKRHGAVSVNEYKKQGYLAEAMNNFLAMIGWNPGTDQEIFNMDELLKVFDIKKVQKGGAIFNQDKLDWINKEHLKKLPRSEVETEIEKHFSGMSGEILKKLTPVILERINKWGDIEIMAQEGEWGYFFEAPKVDGQKLVWKDDGLENAKKHLGEVTKLLEKTDFSSADSIKKAVWSYAEREGKGSVLWPMRYALSGRDKSPDPFTLAYVLGKEETLKRLQSV